MQTFYWKQIFTAELAECESCTWANHRGFGILGGDPSCRVPVLASLESKKVVAKREPKKKNKVGTVHQQQEAFAWLSPHDWDWLADVLDRARPQHVHQGSGRVAVRRLYRSSERLVDGALHRVQLGHCWHQPAADHELFGFDTWSRAVYANRSGPKPILASAAGPSAGGAGMAGSPYRPAAPTRACVLVAGLSHGLQGEDFALAQASDAGRGACGRLGQPSEC